MATSEKREGTLMGRRAMVRVTAGLFGALALGTLATGCGYVAGERRSSFGNGPVFTGSGKSAKKDYDLKGFTAIEVGNAFKVDVTQAADFAVSVTADDNLLDQLDVYVEGETLRVFMKPGSYVNADYRASIKLPVLKRLKVSGASNVQLAGVNSSEHLGLDVSGASRVEGEAVANLLKVELSGASQARLTGKAVSADLEVSGASGAKLESLKVEHVRANLSGASNAQVDVSEKLDANLSGASKLTYSGAATVSSQSVTGASTLARNK